jgi:hypothetical protein
MNQYLGGIPLINIPTEMVEQENSSKFKKEKKRKTILGFFF